MNTLEFAKEKLENFCLYLKDKFKDPKINQEIDNYRNISISDFLFYVRENIANQNIEKYVDEKFSSYLPDKILDKETHTKIIKYLEMFVDLSRD